MALTDVELQRVRFELGYPNLDNAAEPYVGIAAYFTAVLQPYLLGGVSTTSATPVTAATSPTPQSITLASASGFAAGDVVVIDVDARQERATVQSLSGTSMTLQLSLAHTGTFPVVQEGAESIIRDILRELRLISVGMNGASGTLSAIKSRLGLKQVDDVHFFGGGSTLASQGRDPLTALFELQDYWRDELASILGIVRLNDKRNSGGSDLSVY